MSGYSYKPLQLPTKLDFFDLNEQVIIMPS
jgi:hypothetical protein